MNTHDAEISERRELERRLERDRLELIEAAQGMQQPLQALDRAERRVRATAEFLPVITWAVAELALAFVAARWARQMRVRGWPILLFQAWRAYRVLRTTGMPQPLGK